MHVLSEEILNHYEVRKTRAQKAAFRDFLAPRLQDIGYTVTEEISPWIKSTNLVVGDVEKAEIVFTAHYDTCARLPVPNFIAPKNIFLTLLYQLLLAGIMGAAAFLATFTVAYVFRSADAAFLIAPAVCFGLLALMIFGPANPHTANDNTSGVVTLTEALVSLPETARDRVAFVFFDNEEAGLLGSAFFKKKHAKAMGNKPLINFDCVSDGDHFLLVLEKDFLRDTALAGRVERAFMPVGGKTNELISARRAFYPSDQVKFRKSAGVVALRHRPLAGHYLSRIHTARDTVFERENIEILRRFILDMAMPEESAPLA